MKPPKKGPIQPAGLPVEPIQLVRFLRWLGDLSADEIVAAIQKAGEQDDLAERWPELSRDELAMMRQACRDMSKSRLRAWTEGRLRQPTWLEVRALMTGLHQVLE